MTIITKKYKRVAKDSNQLKFVQQSLHQTNTETKVLCKLCYLNSTSKQTILVSANDRWDKTSPIPICLESSHASVQLHTWPSVRVTWCKISNVLIESASSLNGQYLVVARHKWVEVYTNTNVICNINYLTQCKVNCSLVRVENVKQLLIYIYMK